MLNKKKLPSVERVRLKPIWGLRPAYYILLLYLLIFILLFFLFCLLPGLCSKSSWVSFSSPLPLYGVYEDDIYLGNGGDGVFKTTAGEHKYSYYLEGVKIGEEVVEVDRHYFFTLFSHKKTVIEPSFTFSDEVKNKVTTAFLKDIALYSAITDYSSSYSYPPLISDYVKTVDIMGIENIEDEILYTSLHITSLDMYNDYSSALEYLKATTISYLSPELEIVNSVLDECYKENKSRAISKVDNTTEIVVEKNGAFYSYSGGTITLGEDGNTTYPSINKLPQDSVYTSFSIMGNLVTENDYYEFVKENNKWAPENKENLINEGLVDSNYLSGITLSNRSSRPIRAISYYACLAYCEWKSNLDGVKYTLPTLTEWTVSALSAKDKSYVTSLVYVENNSPTPTGLLGQLWEYTKTEYIPLSRLLDEEKIEYLESKFPYDDIIIMGGSYVNEDISIDDIGVISKSSCSDFCGFRMVKHGE